MSYPFEIQFNTIDMLNFQDDICQFIKATTGGLFDYCSKIIKIFQKDYLLRTLAYRIYFELNASLKTGNLPIKHMLDDYQQALGNQDPRQYVVEDHGQTIQFIKYLLGLVDDNLPTQQNYNLLMDNTQINFAVQLYYSQTDNKLIYNQNNIDFAFILYIFLYKGEMYMIYSSKYKDQEIRQFRASALQFNHPLQRNQPESPQSGNDLFNTCYLPQQTTQNLRNTITKQKTGPQIYGINRGQSSKECEICCEQYTIEEEVKLNCQHSFHKQCLVNTLLMEIQNHQSFKNLKCFNNLCNQQIDGVLLKSLIPQQYDKLLSKIVEQKTNATCPKCATLMMIDQEIKGSIKQQKIKCGHCCFEICSLCNQQFHEKKESETCPHLFSQILEIFKGQPIIVCPFCDSISTKDEKCDKVTCSKCKNELCAACSYDRIPSVAHGNHYHRKGCKNYSEWIDDKTKKPLLNEEFDVKKCKRCAESQKPCKRPLDLESYQKLKGFFNK